MYTCRTCSKQYASQKRFLTHLEKCDSSIMKSPPSQPIPKTPQSQQNRSASSVRSNRSIKSIKDIELEDLDTETDTNNIITTSSSSAYRKREIQSTPTTPKTPIIRSTVPSSSKKSPVSTSTSASPRRLMSTNNILYTPELASTSSSRSIDSISKEENEKLIKEKIKLKVEVKKYKDRLRACLDAQSEETRKIQEYYDEKISQLQEENDVLTEENGALQNDLYQEKEKMRLDFSKKLQAEKERLQTKYGEQSFSQVNKLSSTIDKLQTRIAVSTDEKEKIREEYEKMLLEASDSSQSQINALNIQLSELKRTVQRERDDISKQISLVETGKDREIELLQLEKRTVTEALETKYDKLKRDYDSLSSEYKASKEELIAINKSELAEKDNIIKRLKEIHTRNIEFIGQQCDGRIQNQQNKMSLELEQARFNYENKITQLEAKHDQVLCSIKSEYDISIKKYESEIKQAKEAVENMQNTNDSLIEKLKTEQLEKISEIAKQYDNEIIQKDITMKKEIEDMAFFRDQTISELEKVNHRLGQQLGHYKSAMENMETDCGKIKKQFVEALNKQSEENSKVVKEREERILLLERNLDILSEKNNALTKERTEQTQQLQSELSSLKKEIETVTAEMTKYKADSIRVTNDKAIEKRNYENRIDSLIKEHKEKLEYTTINSKKEVEYIYNIELEFLRKNCNKLEQNFNKIEANAHEKDNKLRESLDENIRLSNDLNKITNEKLAVISHRDDLLKQVDKLSNSRSVEIESLKAEIKELKSVSENNQKNYEIAHMKYTELSKQYAEVNIVTQEHIDRATVLSTKLEEKESRLKEISDIVADNKAVYEKQLQIFKVETVELAELRAKYTKLVSVSKDVDIEMKKLRNDNTILTNRVKELIDKNEIYVNTSNNEINELKVKIQDYESKLSNMNNIMNDNNRLNKELNNLISDFNEKIKIEKKINTDLSNKLISTEALCKETEFLRAHNKNIEIIMNKLTDDSNKKLTEQKEQITELQNKIEEYKKEISRVEQLSNHNKILTNDINMLMNKSNSQLLKDKEIIASMDAKLSEKTERLDELVNIIAENKKLYDSHLKQCASEKAQLAETRDIITKLEIENKHLLEQVNDPKNYKDSEERLRKIRDDCIKSLQESKRDNRKLMAELHSVKQKNEIFESLLKDKNDKKENLGN